MLKVKYNGSRFPRMVCLRNHSRKSFLANRLELVIDDYDAYILLRNNMRLTPTVWEFNVIDVVPEEDTLKDTLEEKEEEREETTKKRKKKKGNK